MSLLTSRMLSRHRFPASYFPRWPRRSTPTPRGRGGGKAVSGVRKAPLDLRRRAASADGPPAPEAMMLAEDSCLSLETDICLRRFDSTLRRRPFPQTSFSRPQSSSCHGSCCIMTMGRVCSIEFSRFQPATVSSWRSRCAISAYRVPRARSVSTSERCTIPSPVQKSVSSTEQAKHA